MDKYLCQEALIRLCRKGRIILEENLFWRGAPDRLASRVTFGIYHLMVGRVSSLSPIYSKPHISFSILIADSERKT